ncbi:hypothetical protein A3G67_03620 [Candidatus Roizmanbacteria bacterium RIFCSPLOWO2_12_FULL_40_12]|uniref:Type-4 uracil-DNA glycosylase n=1 Tax=Candidatus Roizmanbacteria bacterium RIFCSPLOWO2_01_FULL_40_42 TaxID=1802066 RepID=A0A1F7J5P4_9BACT|nr:MAG: hypothetical protein A2779_03255 [Candidatus Roizmanbacteria bacterium RIFCSPHIGHO2_01_FULL_40_98]OGK28357.1 MAG: hypothetical protein A3C31_00620 [Candidatus Roizmanbacteria bacterium RIFCSPHIGHO2_02_FULL_40_53]OGK30593.1 MAG: hypothetical protein A2W49_03305 [Candidatus Roizmanbacteria bacterium RIFCSPHIGHO2_12_41_18]OGK37007.1 MAG: hypothetical protein A3E69_00880 [Candidatus Roizmanbacteria bacterium RIFCSPHIGHO2_12_FULL_40_130]OGK50913.1 MAG: hypothetical protein A3B50_01390 [Candi
MGKLQELQKLQNIIVSCSACKKVGSGKLVFGEGSPNAKVIFVGEAPGKKEAESGRPFIGRSGQLLRSIIRSIGLKEKDVYITSPVKYLPRKGTPSRQEIIHSHTHFVKQLEIIQPKIIVLLGKTAVYAILGVDIPVLKDHGKTYEKNGWKIFVTLHPAAVLRFPKYKSLFESDFKKIKKISKN